MPRPPPGCRSRSAATYGASLISRFTLGSLGRGWHSNWDIRAETESTATSTLRGPGGADRFFLADRGGLPRRRPATSASSSYGDGAYRLTETDQTVWQFRSDGKLDYVRTPTATGSRSATTRRAARPA